MTAPANTLAPQGPVHRIHPAEVPGALVKPGAEPILKATDIEKWFRMNHVLKGCSMTVYPAETITIHYDRRENLVAMGVLPPPVVVRAPEAFPAWRPGFVADPPRR